MVLSPSWKVNPSDRDEAMEGTDGEGEQSTASPSVSAVTVQG